MDTNIAGAGGSGTCRLREKFLVRNSMRAGECRFKKTVPRRALVYSLHDSINLLSPQNNSTHSRDAQYFVCDSLAHLVSKDVSVISSKSPSAVFKWSGF